MVARFLGGGPAGEDGELFGGGAVGLSGVGDDGEPVAAELEGDAGEVDVTDDGVVQGLVGAVVGAYVVTGPEGGELDAVCAELADEVGERSADRVSTDFAAQERYFALASPDALAILQRERKGTLLVDMHRRLSMYLRALWGRDFWLRPAAGDGEGARPFIADFTIHLPDGSLAAEGEGMCVIRQAPTAAA